MNSRSKSFIFFHKNQKKIFFDKFLKNKAINGYEYIYSYKDSLRFKHFKGDFVGDRIQFKNRHHCYEFRYSVCFERKHDVKNLFSKP